MRRLIAGAMLAFGLSLGPIIPSPAWADLYGWVDDRGVQNIVDNPALIPERFRRQARLFVASSASRGTESPSTSPSARAQAEGSGQAPSTSLPRAESRGLRRAQSSRSGPSSPVERPAVSAVEPLPSETQGGVAVALAERLALAHRPTPLQAANALLERGILPPAGWMLDEPIDPWWMADLARSLLAASSTGRILQTPETALQTLEGVAAERGIALVAVEPPAPPEPQVIVTQPVALIVETVFVPAFPLHTRHLVHHPHFRKTSFKDHPHFEHRFPKDHGAGQHHHHPLNLHPRHTAIRFDGGFDGELSRTAHRGGKVAGFPHVGSHSVQSGSTMLTGAGSTGARPEPLDSARGKPVEGLTTGGREKRSGATRCASSSMGHSVRICP